MDSKKLQSTAESLHLLIPLIKRKLMRWDLQHEELSISPSHLHILYFLEEKGSATVSEVAKQLCISKSNATPLIQKLFERGFVERINDKNDRRFINIQLTSAGLSFITEYNRLVEEDLKIKLSRISEEDLSKLAASVQSLKEIIMKL